MLLVFTALLISAHSIRAAILPVTCGDSCLSFQSCADAIPKASAISTPACINCAGSVLDNINQKQDATLEGLKLGIRDHGNLMQRIAATPSSLLKIVGNLVVWPALEYRSRVKKDDLEDNMDQCRKVLRKSCRRMCTLSGRVKGASENMDAMKCQHTQVSTVLLKKLEIVPKTFCAIQEIDKKMQKLGRNLVSADKGRDSIKRQIKELKDQLDCNRKSMAVMSTQLQLLMMNDKCHKDLLEQVKALADAASKTSHINGMKANQMMCRIMRLAKDGGCPCAESKCSCCD